LPQARVIPVGVEKSIARGGCQVAERDTGGKARGAHRKKARAEYPRRREEETWEREVVCEKEKTDHLRVKRGNATGIGWVFVRRC